MSHKAECPFCKVETKFEPYTDDVHESGDRHELVDCEGIGDVKGCGKTYVVMRRYIVEQTSHKIEGV